MVTESLFGVMKSFGKRWWWWLHIIVNVINAPELYTYKWLKWLNLLCKV